MSPSMKGLVQTSTNLAGVVSSGGRIAVQCLLRSSVGSEKRDLGERIASVFELAGAEVVLSGAYDNGIPTWIPRFWRRWSRPTNAFSVAGRP